MKYDLAESILKDAMTHWKVDRLRDELSDIQIISEIKYNDYQQYTHGMRYIESLALWLRQFKTEEEKDIAYSFIKEKLIYVSEEEMRQLVEFSYDIKMKPYLIDKTRDFCSINNIYDPNIRNEVYQYFRRRTLFLGLSDGSHIDFFRRHNPILSNEQVFVHYNFSNSKAKDMLDELKSDINKDYSKHSWYNNDKISFDTFFLIDDFSASGQSYIRHDKTGWHGKLHKFISQLQQVGYSNSSVDIHLVLYLSTHKAIKYIKQKTEKYFREQKIAMTITTDAMQIIEPINCDENLELDALLKNNYNNLVENYQSFEDRHYKIGNGKFPYRGFSDCSLPLIIYHNTPNNSFPILWYSWEDSVNALFPRISRHKEV